MGDFNTSLNDSNKLRGSQVADDSHSYLMNFINDNLLLNLDLGGVSYTWSNMHARDALIQVKLDWALISLDWLQFFSCSLFSLTRLRSDHFPISLNVELMGCKSPFPSDLKKCGLATRSCTLKLLSCGILMLMA